MKKELLDYFNNDELASSVWEGKYALPGETTPDDMHRRMAIKFSEVEDKYFESEKQADFSLLSTYGREREKLTYEKIYHYFKDFKYIIPQGSVMSQLGSPNIGSLSNCFVIGQPIDSYGGIFQKEQEMVQLMKRRGGVGIDLSLLRPDGVSTTNAAKSSTGAVSFMHRYSNGTREVAQKGRRGALMISMDINHPDVLEFIKIKRDLTQVTGANISIKLNKEFMEAVEKDEDYILKFPCEQDISHFSKEYLDSPYNELIYLEDHKRNNEVFYTKKVKAKEYWDEIIKSAHSVAEPGLMFWDNMVEYSPDGVYPQFKQITTNPCSEIGMQPYDACRLIANNLFSFVVNPFTKDAYFAFDEFYRVNYESMRLSDDLVDLEMQHIERILDKIEKDPEPDNIKGVEKELWKKVYVTAKASRRTGLGFTALGDALAALGVKYDSDEGLVTIEKIMKVKMKSELDCTTDMSITRGTFEGWNRELEFPTDKDDITVGANPFYKFLQKEFPEQYLRMYQYGRRNVSWSCVAPTGSLSIIAKATRHSNVSSGLEPVFMPYYMRRKKVDSKDPKARIDFTDSNGDTWQEYPVVMGAFKDWYIVAASCEHIPEKAIELLGTADADSMDKIFKASPWYGSTANDIDWERRVEIQSVIQKYITHSISSTINLPSDVSEEEVSKIYLSSCKLGLKGITVYRDGSRSGVLVSQKDAKLETFEYRDAPKRPSTLDADVYNVTSKGEEFEVIIGLYDDKPYEVFVTSGHRPGGYSRGLITKKKAGKYELNLVKVNSEITETLSLDLSDEEVALTRMISTALRHGADIKFVVEQLNKANGTIVSFSKAIARTLKKYIPDGTKSTLTCEECGGENIIFIEGCNSCRDCGSSACS